MATTYTWVITQIEGRPEYEGNAKVVTNIGWNRIATDGVRTVTACGAQDIPYNAEHDFINFDDLTQPDLCAWLEEAIGANALGDLDDTLNKRIDDLKSPPIVELTPPWAVK